MGKTEKTSFQQPERKSRAAEVANTFEWLITAFILAFVFRAFVMEAYRIPTGSMANTLRGAHFRLRCQQCGYKYNYGLGNYGLPRDTLPHGYLKPMSSRCPSCGNYQQTGGTMPVAYGDRILVLKCIYQLFEPKQWDVIVFKNPLDPAENYIKRLIGRPGETVEIIDGDIYINGQISRKPPKAQKNLWMPVYDNDYQPIRPNQPSFNKHKWTQPFRNSENSKWELDKGSPTKFSLDSPETQMNYLVYDNSIGNDFRATYAYNAVRSYKYLPYCSDLKTRLYCRFTNTNANVGIELSKYQTTYRAWFDSSGKMVIAKVSQDAETILNSKQIEQPTTDKSVLVEFANVDHQLIFQFGSEKLVYDLGRSPDGAGPRETDIAPQVKIFGSGKLTLSHIAIFRDIHYTTRKYANSSEMGRATEGKPLKLGEDEFFVLGDNSPNSEDGRWWNRQGVGNNGRLYRKGIVPREYLVGKAMFVYWPSGFKPFPRFRFGIIPNIGQMRFIYGGSDKKTDVF